VIDWIFNCNIRYLTQAYENKTYNYVYGLGFSMHSADTFLTFCDVSFNVYGTRKKINIPVAIAWQLYLISFIKHGDPNVLRLQDMSAQWELAGREMNVVNLQWNGYRRDVDEQVDAEKCLFWQRAEYAPTWKTSRP
jgi:hypothetical protein